MGQIHTHFGAKHLLVMENELIVSTILGFVPPTNFLDVATVSKTFKRNYVSRRTELTGDTSANNLVEYFRSGMPKTERVPLKASKLGRLDLFEIAFTHGCVISHKTTEAAARGGHINIVKYIARTTKLCTLCACTGASKGGKLNILEWVFPAKQRFTDEVEMSTMIIRNAAVGGFLPIVAWAHDRGQELDSALLGTAATYGHFEVVKYIHSHQLASTEGGLGEYPISAILHAALKGDLQTLVWLREKGYPWSDGICMILARRGYLEALKYVRSQGCPWGMLRIGSVGPVIDEDMHTYLVEEGCLLW